MFTMVFSLIPAWWFWVKTDGDLDNGGVCMVSPRPSSASSPPFSSSFSFSFSSFSSSSFVFDG